MESKIAKALLMKEEPAVPRAYFTVLRPMRKTAGPATLA